MAQRQVDTNCREEDMENNSKKMCKNVSEESTDPKDDDKFQIQCEIIDKSSVNEFMIMVSKCGFEWEQKVGS